MPTMFLFGDSHAGTLADYRTRHWSELPATRRDHLHVNFVDEGGLAHDMLMDLSNGRRIINPVMQKTLHLAGLYNRYSGNLSCKDIRILLLFGYADVHMLGFHPYWRGYTISERSENLYKIDPVLIDATLRSRLGGFFEFTKKLAGAGAKVTLLPGPPPHRSNEHILRHRRDLKFLPSPDVRLGVFRQITAIFQEKSTADGIEFLNLSTLFADQDGYLGTDYEGDGVHANSFYAKVYLNRIFDLFT